MRVYNLIRRIDEFMLDLLDLLMFYPLLFIASLIVDRIEVFEKRRKEIKRYGCTKR